MARKLQRGARSWSSPPTTRASCARSPICCSRYGIEAVSAGALGLPEPEENAPDFVGNARIKALAAATREQAAGTGG